MRGRRGVLIAFVLALLLAAPAAARAAGCPFRRPTRLARQGDGWLIPATWAQRGLNWGTPSMIGLIQRVASRVARGKGGTLYVADLSRKEGGRSEWHRSHTCGRDVDLLFYALDEDGDQAPPPAQMISFDADGRATYGGQTLRFDVARNWALVKAIVQDRVVIEKIFIAEPLERRLLAYARERKESKKLIALADSLMSQPSDSAPHDDHLHVRIALEAADRVARAPAKAPKAKAAQGKGGPKRAPVQARGRKRSR